MSWFLGVLLLEYVVFFTICVFGVDYVDVSENLSGFFDGFLFVIFVILASLDFGTFLVFLVL